MKEAVSWNDIERELQSYTFPDKENETVVFGTGLLGQVITPALLEEDLRITAFCDNDEQKWGTEIHGLPCVAPQKLKEYKKPFALVAAIKYHVDISRQLSEMGIPCCTADAYVVRENLSRFHEVYRMLDANSRDIYAKVLLCRIRGDLTGVRDICTDHQYFALPEFRYCGCGEVFVDCGAYTGEIIQTFINNVSGMFRKIYAFELNSAALEAMKRRLSYERDMWLFSDDQIVFEHKVMAKEGGLNVPVYIDQANAMSSFTQETIGKRTEERGETTSLDQYFENKTVTFLKADIEGSEWNMLLGGAKTIQINKPKIAICIYHNIYDFFRIPLLLRKWVPEYRFAVRHHWNSFDETVLYCYV